MDMTATAAVRTRGTKELELEIGISTWTVVCLGCSFRVICPRADIIVAYSLTDPEVIPLQFSGSVDANATDLTASELMRWGLANLWDDGHEGGYAVRHGARPVDEFGPSRHGRRREGTSSRPAGDDNFGDSAADSEMLESRPLPEDDLFEKAYPCLFPYGRGGIEAVRPVDVDFASHVRWCLQYHDRRFRKHESFPFLAFGMLQKREVLSSARLQMRRRDFGRIAAALSAITVEQLRAAEREEAANQPISDASVRLLVRHVQATARRVRGSNQCRTSYRSQIWSTALVHGPPSGWLTINLTDVHDPTFQFLAGEDIDLDAFVATLGPDPKQRAANVAADPYAAAKFFHYTIRTILETLFKIRVTQFQVKSEMGVLGEVTAYFGTVESQNRGSLHLHMLFWLKNTPSPDEMLELLKSEEFRDKIRAYIKANIRAYVPGLESAESVAAIPKSKTFLYNRPPKPGTDNYEAQLDAFELQLARIEQVHVCKPRRCLFPNKHGRLRCKRKAPWVCAVEDFVRETGEWGPKRLFNLVNNWNPHVLICGRCNNDIKLLTSGEDTRNVTFYVTSYAAKKQGKAFNLSAVLTKGFIYHLDHPNPAYIGHLQENQRLLLARLTNTINREQELSAQMVMSYLMGWGDVYRSHAYTPIYWSSFSRELVHTFVNFGGHTQRDNQAYWVVDHTDF